MEFLLRTCKIMYAVDNIAIFNNAYISKNGINIDINNNNIGPLLRLLEMIFIENNSDDKQICINGNINQIFTISNNIISISIIPTIGNNNYFMVILKMTSTPTIYFKVKLDISVIVGKITGEPTKHRMDLTKYNINDMHYKYVWSFTKQVDV